MVEINIIDSKYPLMDTSRRYKFSSGGDTYSNIMSLAKEKVKNLLKANEVSKEHHSAYYHKILMAILPHPNEEGKFYLEDRSEYTYH